MITNNLEIIIMISSMRLYITFTPVVIYIIRLSNFITVDTLINLTFNGYY